MTDWIDPAVYYLLRGDRLDTAVTLLYYHHQLPCYIDDIIGFWTIFFAGWFSKVLQHAL